MAAAPYPENEEERLRALAACELLDTPSDPRFDAFVRLASRLYGVPYALVSLVDRDRQWFKAAIGLPQGGSMPRELSFCAHAILRPGAPMLVADTLADPRFADHPLVLGPPHFRFYAAVPLLDGAGQAVGSLCILDLAPRDPDSLELAPLQELALGLSTLVEHGQSLAALRESDENYRHTIELSPQMPWTADPDGMILSVGPRWPALIGMRLEETLGDGWLRALHPEDVAPTLRAWGVSLRSGAPVDLEYRLSDASGEYSWYRVRAAARYDAEGRILRWYGTIEDVNEAKAIREALRKSDELARGVLESTPVCIKVLDLTGYLIFMNAPGMALFELETLDSLEGWGWRQVLPADYVAAVQQGARAAALGESMEFTIFCPTARGRPKWWEISISPIAGADGLPYRLLWISRDVTEEKLAREQQQAAAARLADVLETTSDCVAVLDRDWVFTYVNGRAEAWFARRGPALGASAWALLATTADASFARQLRRAMAQAGPTTFEEFLPSLEAWLEVHAYPSGEGLTLFFRDVSERRRAEAEQRRSEQRIAHMARHDGLTGLANRAFFQDEIGRALEEGAAGCALLFLDLDNFKDVNDALGHLGGDQLLQQAAARLGQVARGAACIARLGGDEFGLLLRGAGPREAIGGLAVRIIDAVSEPYLIEGQRLRVGASIGIALPSPLPDEAAALAAEALIRQADMALYSAKTEGPGLYRFFAPEMTQRMQSKRALRNDLREALENSEFSLAFQPVVALGGRRVVACEALLRWFRPGRGAISPAEFVPVAEETGLIVPLGRWVLRQACLAALDWPEGIGVAVNLSPAQFTGPGLVEAVAAALEESGLPASRLELEITESVLLHEDSQALDTLHALRAMGIGIAMDDFGTGYSSLSYLRRFPFDKIKIDRSFIADLPERAQSLAILRAIVGLGRSFDMPITAEGVETPEQAAMVEAEGCRYAQGYLFSRPLPRAEIASYLAAAERAALAG
ncbi:EAL domain-containing protein [Roseomonas sp. 18066]|uniref:bifunctional diguanylate cyclase/phosphodiesterase n=1 Tax=Roseomonas sp. 18066 TaxID=2681412 RepID=UPI00135A4AF7|nr:EAL domain-containing protein [Roseomonas sp. 18066]